MTPTLRRRNENDLQMSVARWMALQYPKALWITARSGFNLARASAGISKAMGHRKGTPDMLIFEPRGVYHGLFIELKMPGGRTSPEQLRFKAEAEERRYWCAICPTTYKTETQCFDWAINCITEYMTLAPGGGV